MPEPNLMHLARESDKNVQNTDDSLLLLRPMFDVTFSFEYKGATAFPERIQKQSVNLISISHRPDLPIQQKRKLKVVVSSALDSTNSFFSKSFWTWYGVLNHLLTGPHWWVETSPSRIYWVSLMSFAAVHSIAPATLLPVWIALRRPPHGRTNSYPAFRW